MDQLHPTHGALASPISTNCSASQGEYLAGHHLVVGRQLAGVFRYTHHGIAAPGLSVIHYSGFSDGPSTGPVCLSSLDDFVESSALYVRLYAFHRLPLEETVSRARSRVGEAKYDLVFNNCEHFATWCAIDRIISAQVASVLSKAALLLAVVAAGAVFGLSSFALLAASRRGAVRFGPGTFIDVEFATFLRMRR